MNISDQMISVEEMIKIPDCRRPSPKKRKTRKPHTSRITRAPKPPISPTEAKSSRGTARNSFIAASQSCAHRRRGAPRPAPLAPGCSFDHQDLRVGREQGLREDLVEHANREERDGPRLVDGAADALGAAGGGHALVAADDRDDRAEQHRLQR